MSKAALKKLLGTLTPEQKDELILDLYSARGEAKEYLEFFLNPDIDKLVSDTTSDIVKEVYRRGKYGYNKPRILRLRNLIKNVATLNPGSEYVNELRFRSIHALVCATDDGYWFSDACIASFVKIIREALQDADKEGSLGTVAARYRKLIEGMSSSLLKRSSRYTREKLLEGYRESMKILAGESVRE